MPELPEVETMIRGVRDAVTGRIVEDFRECPCSCKPLAISPGFNRIRKRLLGTTLTEIGRYGKRIVLTHSNGDRLVLEPRMTGLLLLDEPPDDEHLRFEWTLSKGRKTTRLRFWDRRGLGTCTLFREKQWHDWLASEKIGPDAIEMTDNEWQQRLSVTSRAVKVALLDQKLVAGIGNLYASEILHVCGIHPALPANRLSAAQIDSIARETRTVLNTAIKYEGSTLSDGTYRNALNKAGGYQNHHRVYAREGTVCPTCKRGEVVRIVQTQRATFYCPVCQPKTRTVARKK